MSVTEYRAVGGAARIDRRSSTAPVTETTASPLPGSAPARLVSLDVFRGLTVAAMVIVNNPGDGANVYWPLDHAKWNGWTPTDLIFPFFLFIVGVSITLSRRSASWGDIARRASIILAIGWFLAGYPRFNVATWRIPGVLPRIAVCYFCAAVAYQMVRGDRRRRGAILGLVAVAFMLLYWIVMTAIPNPAGVRGDLTPDGNWGAYIDRAVFGRHLWVSSKTWDPEGVLSTVPAIATTLLGIVAGLWLGSNAAARKKALWLGVAGIAALAIGQLWDVVFPINKNLWTSSYVAFTAGFAAVLLAVSYWAIDVKGWRGWTKPFVVLGANAITLFAASALLVKTLALIKVPLADGSIVPLSRYLFVTCFAPLASPKNASLLYAIANLVVLWALLAWMYRRRIFLRA
jgi:predicted acyltransferase